MLEGLEVSEVNLRYALTNNDIFRIDSAYFKKQFLTQESLIRLKDGHRLKTLGIQVRSFGAYSLNNDVEYIDNGIPFIRGINMKNGRVDFNNILHIGKESHSILWKSEVKPGSVLLSMSGTVGDVAIATKSWKYPVNSNQDIAKIDTNGRINSFILYAFLLSKLGQNYLNREARGSVQQHVFLSQIEQLEIPFFSKKLATNIQCIIEKSEEKYSKATTLAKTAETTLLRALGLENWQPPEPLSYIRNSGDVFKAGRLDAEHFQPKYNEVLDIVKKIGIKMVPLGDIIVPVKNGFDARDFVEVGTPYIRVGDIKNCRINIETSARVALRITDIKKDICLKVGDILFTRKGSFGNAAPVRENQENAIISSEIMLIRRQSQWLENILPEYLALFFNSLLGRLQAEKWAHGAAFYSVSQDDLIPISHNRKA